MKSDTSRIQTPATNPPRRKVALVEDKPRGASAIVKADAELVRIDRKRFLFLVQQTPYFSVQLMAIMAERLRRMNEML